VGTGTSASTAIVSGAAALVWSRYPELTGEQVIRHLLATTTDKGAPGPDVEYGYGDLDVVRALETVPAPPPTTTVTSTPSLGPTEVAARTPDSSGGGSGSGETGLVAAFGAILAAGCLGLARWRGHRQRPVAAGPNPGPDLDPWAPAPGLPLPASQDPAPRAHRPRSAVTLTATIVVIVMAALVGGCYAAVH
jgi:subtilisin family serine protease